MVLKEILCLDDNDNDVITSHSQTDPELFRGDDGDEV